VYEFEYPWLLALLPVPALVWWLLPPYREEQSSVRVPFFERMSAAAGLQPRPGAVVLKTNWLQKILAPLCWTLFVVAMARPQFVEPPVRRIQPGRDLMLALDISQSMEARDFLTPRGQRVRRIDGVKRVVDQFIGRREGDRIGLIVFGAAAYPQVPFTLDHASCRALLDEIDVGMAGPRTVLGDAIGLAIRQFEQSKTKEKVLILLTDGNDTGSRMPPDRAAAIAKEHGIIVHTIAIGDPNGTGEDKTDVGTMKAIGRITGGQFYLGQDEKQLTDIYSTLDRITPQNFEVNSWRPKRPLYMIPLGAGLTLLILYHILLQVWHALRSVRRRSQDTGVPEGI
jgi:Ca-activated chloride channel family protein